MQVRLPAPTDYAVALLDPIAAFERNDLEHASFKRGPLGVVVQTGENTVVARCTIDGKDMAVRCHVKDDPDREHRFRTVDEHLAQLGSRAPAAIVRAEYLPEGMVVRGVRRPVSLMPWIPGENLRQFVEKRAGDREALIELSDRWSALTEELARAQYVHGDPSHRNIIVRDDGLKLIDPDVAWVPALGETAPVETGNPAFQHPGRAKAMNSLALDHFPNLVIYVSLRALAADPSLWKYTGSERLILDARDFAEPHVSEAFIQMLSSPDPDVRVWTAKLMQLCLGGIEHVPSLDAFLRASRPPDTYEPPAKESGFVLPPNSRRASWLAAHMRQRV